MTEETNSISATAGNEFWMNIAITSVIIILVVISIVLAQQKKLEEYTRMGILEEDLSRMEKIVKRIDKRKQEVIKRLRKELNEIYGSIDSFTTEQTIEKIENLKRKIDRLRKKIDKPPIITMPGLEFRFKSGSGDADQEFFDLINDRILPQIKENYRRFGVTVIEIFGHTDEQPYGDRSSNLDKTLPEYLSGSDVKISVTSNSELGMWRAATVARYFIILRDYYEILNENFIIKPYSGGQFHNIDGSMSYGNSNKPDWKRRRIEIRMKLPD